MAASRKDDGRPDNIHPSIFFLLGQLTGQIFHQFRQAACHYPLQYIQRREQILLLLQQGRGPWDRCISGAGGGRAADRPAAFRKAGGARKFPLPP